MVLKADDPRSLSVQRVAFRLRLKPDAIEEYESAHAQVGPELLAKLKEVGISDYSIFSAWSGFVSLYAS
jgi:L-rhamnose mutarotase